jgi:hypothetical protein
VASAKVARSDPRENMPRFCDDTADIATAGSFIDNWVVFLSRPYGGSSYKDQLWEEMEEKTRLLPDRNGKPVEAIAGALLERETLSYDDVIRILKEQCPDFHGGEDPDRQ